MAAMEAVNKGKILKKTADQLVEMGAGSFHAHAGPLVAEEYRAVAAAVASLLNDPLRGPVTHTVNCLGDCATWKEATAFVLGLKTMEEWEGRVSALTRGMGLRALRRLFYTDRPARSHERKNCTPIVWSSWVAPMLPLREQDAHCVPRRMMSLVAAASCLFGPTLTDSYLGEPLHEGGAMNPRDRLLLAVYVEVLEAVLETVDPTPGVEGPPADDGTAGGGSGGASTTSRTTLSSGWQTSSNLSWGAPPAPGAHGLDATATGLVEQRLRHAMGTERWIIAITNAAVTVSFMKTVVLEPANAELLNALPPGAREQTAETVDQIMSVVDFIAAGRDEDSLPDVIRAQMNEAASMGAIPGAVDSARPGFALGMNSFVWKNVDRAKTLARRGGPLTAADADELLCIIDDMWTAAVTLRTGTDLQPAKSLNVNVRVVGRNTRAIPGPKTVRMERIVVAGDVVGFDASGPRVVGPREGDLMLFDGDVPGGIFDAVRTEADFGLWAPRAATPSPSPARVMQTRPTFNGAPVRDLFGARGAGTPPAATPPAAAPQSPYVLPRPDFETVAANQIGDAAVHDSVVELGSPADPRRRADPRAHQLGGRPWVTTADVASTVGAISARFHKRLLGGGHGLDPTQEFELATMMWYELFGPSIADVRRLEWHRSATDAQGDIDEAELCVESLLAGNKGAMDDAFLSLEGGGAVPVWDARQPLPPHAPIPPGLVASSLVMDLDAYDGVLEAGLALQPFNLPLSPRMDIAVAWVRDVPVTGYVSQDWLGRSVMGSPGGAHAGRLVSLRGAATSGWMACAEAVDAATEVGWELRTAFLTADDVWAARVEPTVAAPFARRGAGGVVRDPHWDPRGDPRGVCGLGDEFSTWDRHAAVNGLQPMQRSDSVGSLAVWLGPDRAPTPIVTVYPLGFPDTATDGTPEGLDRARRVTDEIFRVGGVASWTPAATYLAPAAFGNHATYPASGTPYPEDGTLQCTSTLAMSAVRCDGGAVLNDLSNGSLFLSAAVRALVDEFNRPRAPGHHRSIAASNAAILGLEANGLSISRPGAGLARLLEAHAADGSDDDTVYIGKAGMSMDAVVEEWNRSFADDPNDTVFTTTDAYRKEAAERRAGRSPWNSPALHAAMYCVDISAGTPLRGSGAKPLADWATCVRAVQSSFDPAASFLRYNPRGPGAGGRASVNRESAMELTQAASTLNDAMAVNSLLWKRFLSKGLVQELSRAEADVPPDMQLDAASATALRQGTGAAEMVPRWNATDRWASLAGVLSPSLAIVSRAVCRILTDAGTPQLVPPSQRSGVSTGGYAQTVAVVMDQRTSEELGVHKAVLRLDISARARLVEEGFQSEGVEPVDVHMSVDGMTEYLCGVAIEAADAPAGFRPDARWFKYRVKWAKVEWAAENNTTAARGMSLPDGFVRVADTGVSGHNAEALQPGRGAGASSAPPPARQQWIDDLKEGNRAVLGTMLGAVQTDFLNHTARRKDDGNVASGAGRLDKANMHLFLARQWAAFVEDCMERVDSATVGSLRHVIVPDMSISVTAAPRLRVVVPMFLGREAAMGAMIPWGTPLVGLFTWDLPHAFASKLDRALFGPATGADDARFARDLAYDRTLGAPWAVPVDPLTDAVSDLWEYPEDLAAMYGAVYAGMGTQLLSSTMGYVSGFDSPDLRQLSEEDGAGFGVRHRAWRDIDQPHHTHANYTPGRRSTAARNLDPDGAAAEEQDVRRSLDSVNGNGLGVFRGWVAAAVTQGSHGAKTRFDLMGVMQDDNVVRPANYDWVGDVPAGIERAHGAPWPTTTLDPLDGSSGGGPNMDVTGRYNVGIGAIGAPLFWAVGGTAGTCHLQAIRTTPGPTALSVPTVRVASGHRGVFSDQVGIERARGSRPGRRLRRPSTAWRRGRGRPCPSPSRSGSGTSCSPRRRRGLPWRSAGRPPSGWPARRRPVRPGRRRCWRPRCPPCGTGRRPAAGPLASARRGAGSPPPTCPCWATRWRLTWATASPCCPPTWR